MECWVRMLLLFSCVLAALEPTLASAGSYRSYCVGSLTNNTIENFIKLPLSAEDKNTKSPGQVNQCLKVCYDKGFRYGALTDESICYCGKKFVGSEIGCATQSQGIDNPNEGYKSNLIYGQVDLKPTLSAISSENLGCYRDSPSSPVLDDFQTNLTSVMTVELCLILCINHGNHYAGLQAGNMCFCGDCCYNRDGKLSDDQCNITCEGDKTQMCGGDKSNIVYKLGFGCGEPLKIKNAELIPNQQMKSSAVVYKCKEGYFKTGGEEIMSCYWNDQEKSEWNSSSPLKCKAKPIILEYFIGAVIALALVGITWRILKVCNKRIDRITNFRRYPLVIAVEEETLTIVPVPPTNYDTI